MPDADYFSAADDASAVAVIEAGGPARAGLDVIFLKDIDPVVSCSSSYDIRGSLTCSA